MNLASFALIEDLVTETKQLIFSVKSNYLLIAVNLFKIKSSKEWGDEWPTFYTNELQLKKSQVSKLLKVGEFVHNNGFVQATVGYETLYQAMNALPEKVESDPKYVLSVAETWSEHDFKSERKDNCDHSDPPILVCPKCWKKM